METIICAPVVPFCFYCNEEVDDMGFCSCAETVCIPDSGDSSEWEGDDSPDRFAELYDAEPPEDWNWELASDTIPGPVS